MSLQQISLRQPDDWHLHLRDGEALNTTVPHSARCFSRAIVMPNLQPPVTTVAAALAYRARILAARPAHSTFLPLMTLYLTDATTSEEIDNMARCTDVLAVKYYPAHATTNAEHGVSSIARVMPVLERMARLDIPLLLHGEVTDAATDIFDREKCFIEQVLAPLRQRLPELRIVLEHITTREAVDYVMAADHRLAATLTAHHLLYNRNDLLAAGVKPHFYCLPVLKRSTHQQALIGAAISGNPRFFLGTDSAPHSRAQKQSACGCAGIYTAPAALELYAEVFARHDALDRLENFASVFGPQFYRLPLNTATVTLQRQDWQLPAHYPLAAEQVVPLRAGTTIHWRLED